MWVCAGKGGWEQQQAMVRWKEYIDWERSNPQSLDGPALTARISLAYDQSLMYLLHYPEVIPSLSPFLAIQE